MKTKHLLTDLQRKRIELYKKGANQNSRFYFIDLNEFITNVMNEPAQKSIEIISRIEYMNSESFDNYIRKEEAKLERGGMYDVNNMRPINQLD